MTIAEILFEKDPKMLFEIIVLYQLEWLARLYFSEMIIDPQSPEAEQEAKAREFARLMRPSSYTGRVERRRGAIIQPHRSVIW